MSLDLVELRALQADMRQLVDAFQNLPSPSSLHTTELEPRVIQPPPPVKSESNMEEEDDWPAPPLWPDSEDKEWQPGDSPVLHHPYSRMNVFSCPERSLVSQPQVQHSAHESLLAKKPRGDAAHPSPPWFKPVQPLLPP